jgi:hypothetical protein
MSETFTPVSGPYHARVLGRVTDDQEIPIVANAGGCPDAVIAVVGYDCPEKRLIGTALLFQAAPDLLEACRSALKFVAASDSTEGDQSYEMLRAAIAKAEGGVA